MKKIIYVLVKKGEHMLGEIYVVVIVFIYVAPTLIAAIADAYAKISESKRKNRRK